MAGKVNYRFVALLGAVLIVCTLGLVGFWYMFVRTVPSEAIARGEGFFEQGQYARAAEHFGKALGKRPNDTQLLLRYSAATERIELGDIRTARDTVKRLKAAYEKVLQLDPAQPEALDRLMDLYLRIGRDLGDLKAWDRMLTVTNAALDVDADLIVARQYRGIAQVNRMAVLDVSSEDRALARRDLDAAAEQMQDNVEVTGHLVRWHLIEARRLTRTADQAAKVSEHRKQALELSEQSLERDSADPMRRLHHVRVLGSLGQRADQAELLGQLEEQMLVRPSPADAALAVANRLIHAGTQDAGPTDDSTLGRAEAILLAAVGKHSHDLRFHAALGRVLALQGRDDQAVGCLKAACDIPIEATAVAMLRDADLQSRLLAQYADLLLARAEKNRGEQREAVLSEVQAVVERIEATSGRIPTVSLINGKIDMARGHWAKALASIDHASSLCKDTNIEALRLSAAVRIELGEPGAAISRLDRLVQLRPGYPGARHELMRLHLQLAQYDQLRRHIDEMLSIAPNDFEARRFEALMLARQGRTQQAIAAIRTLNPAEHPELAPPLARLHIAQGDRAEAVRLLKEAFEQAPADSDILVGLLSLTEDVAEAGRYIQAARDAGGDDQALDLLQDQTSAPLTGATIEQLLDRQQDPLRRQLGRYRFYTAQGDAAKAAEALAAAAAVSANDPGVVEAMFRQAISAKDWSTAERLVRTAADHDLDAAGGAFYRGRLDLARGRADSAIASFLRAVERRKVYSRGWRYLGDAQRSAGDTSAAAASYRQALAQNPADVAAVKGMVATLNEQARHDEALQLLRSTMQRPVSDTSLLRLYLTYEQDHGDVQRALTVRRSIASANPADTDNHRALAVLLARLRQFDEASATLDAIVETEGDTIRNAFAAATISRLAGDVGKARQHLLDRVVAMGDEAAAEDWMLLGRFLVTTGDVKAGIDAYRKAMAGQDPERRLASRQLADLLFDIGRNDEAATLYGDLHQAEPDDRLVAWRYVESLIRAEQVDQARQALDRLVETFGQSADAHLLAAVAARAAGEPDKALAALDYAAQLAPDRAIIYFKRAQLQIEQKAPVSEIRAELAKAIELDPGLSAARLLLARLLLDDGDRTDAILQLREALKQSPGNVSVRIKLADLYFAERQLDQLAALLDESARMFADKPLWRLMQARVAALQGRHDVAAKYLTKAFELAPDANVLADLAEQMIRTKQYGAALDVLKRHRDAVAATAQLAAVRALAIAAIGTPLEAQAAFDEAIDVCDIYDQTYKVAARTAAVAGHEDTIARLHRSVEQAGRPLPATRLRAQIAAAQLLVKAGRYKAAVTSLLAIESDVTELSDARADHQRLLAISLHQSGDYDRAKSAYEQILASDPDNIEAINNLAYLLADNLGQADAALPLASRARQLAPDNAQVLDTVGWIEFRAGKEALATTTLTRSVQLKPLPANCYHLAMALYGQGQQSRADEMLAKARDLAEEAADVTILAAINQRLQER